MQSIDHQELARCLFDESNDAFFIFRPEDNSLVDANPTALRLTGLSHAELMERRLPELFSAETDKDIEGIIDAFQKTGIFHSGEDYELRRREQEPLPVRVTASRIHAESQPLGLVVVCDISRRKRAESELKLLNEQLESRVAARTAELEHSEQRFRSLIENSFDVITMFDETGTPRYISPSIKRVLGYEPNELIGQQGLRIVHPDDAEEAGRFFARGLEQPDQPTTMTHRIRHKDGNYRTVEVTGINLLDVPGVAAMVSNFRDVTERLEAEQALAANEAQLHQLADNVEEVLWVVAGDLSEVFYVSPAYERIWGCSVESLYENPRSFIAAVHEDDKPALMAAIGRRSEGETTEATAVEYRIVRPDGDIRWIRSRQSSIGGADGTAARMVGVAEDITERKQAEHRLRESEQKFRALAEVIPVSIGIAQDNRRVFGNRRSEELTGYSRDELMGREAGSLTHPDYRDRMRQQLKHCLEQQIATHSESKIVRKDGQTRWVDFSTAPFEWNGRPAVLAASVDITERKQTEQALRASEDRFRRLIEHAPEAIMLHDETGRFIRVNAAAERLFGMSADQICELGPLEMSPPTQPNGQSSDEMFFEMLNQVRAGETPVFEWTTFNGEGHKILCEVRLMGLQMNDRFVIRGSVTDITERKQAEHDLLVRDTAIATSVMPAVFGDPNYVITHANKAFADLMGFDSPEQVIGMPNSRFESQPTSIAQINAAMEQHGSWTGEIVSRKLDGTPIDLYMSTTLICDEAGEPACSLATFLDITERKKIERKLDESERRHRAIVEDQTEFIVRWTPDGTRTFVNDAYCRVFGGSYNELVGTSFFPLICESDRAKVLARISRLSPENPVSTDEHRAILPNSEIVWQQWTDRAIYDSDGQLVEYQSVGRGVTERVHAEQQREQLIQELETKNAELERFTYTVSHDLKSPLVTISGFIGMLKKDLVAQNEEAIADDMAEIAGGVKQMKELLEQLLDLSRVGRVMQPPADVSLNELMTEVVESVGGAVAQRNAKIDVGELLTIRCDRVRMREVLQNLVENAIKFCDVEPHVEVGVRNGENEPVVFVRDNGIGVDPDYSEKVFGLFEQLDANRDGTGIGLALAKRIIESHGGRIWVESDGVGHGSTFCFTVKENDER